MAITVPAGMTLRSAKTNHRGSTVYYESVDVRVAIPEGKLAAVRAAQASYGPRFAMDIGGASSPYRNARGFRQRFNAMKTEAEVDTYLAAINTAITT